MTFQFDPEIESQINAAALQMGKTRQSFVRVAVLSYLEDLHDAQIAAERLKDPGKRIPLSEVVKNLGLDDVDD